MKSEGFVCEDEVKVSITCWQLESVSVCSLQTIQLAVYFTFPIWPWAILAARERGQASASPLTDELLLCGRDPVSHVTTVPSPFGASHAFERPFLSFQALETQPTCLALKVGPPHSSCGTGSRVGWKFSTSLLLLTHEISSFSFHIL